MKNKLEGLLGLTIGSSLTLFYEIQMLNYIEKVGYGFEDMGVVGTVNLGAIALLLGGIKIGNRIEDKYNLWKKNKR